MKIKSFKFTDVDEKIVEELKNSLNIATDIGVIRLALTSLQKNGQVYTMPRLMAEEPVKKKKYTKEQIDGYCEKSVLEKGRCPKCIGSNGENMTSSECACLKSEGGRLSLRMWLNEQYI